MFEVCLIWDGELVCHKADSFAECKEWVACYNGVKGQVSNVRLWFGDVCLGKL